MNRQYYQEVVTQKSWEELVELKKQFEFILIGGWAVFLFTKSLKSKDIDIIVDYSQLNLFRKHYEMFKNERLKKYEIKKEGIDIDIYLPHFSDLGLPVEELIKYKTKIETFTVLEKEVLLIVKQKAYISRKASIKGQKDLIDIMALILLKDFDFKFHKELVVKYKLEYHIKILEEMINEITEVKELNLNRHQIASEKKRILKNFK